jgi:hypothetical protein
MNGLRLWVGTDEVSTVKVPITYEPGDLRHAVRALRRAIRDLRDRRGRRPGGKMWRRMAVGGLLGADGYAVLHVHHAGVAKTDLLAMLARQWPDVGLCHPDIPLALDWSVEDRVALARIRRSAEPLRVVVAPQGTRVPIAQARSGGYNLEPMPYTLS